MGFNDFLFVSKQYQMSCRKRLSTLGKPSIDKYSIDDSFQYLKYYLTQFKKLLSHSIILNDHTSIKQYQIYEESIQGSRGSCKGKAQSIVKSKQSSKADKKILCNVQAFNRKMQHWPCSTPGFCLSLIRRINNLLKQQIRQCLLDQSKEINQSLNKQLQIRSMILIQRNLLVVLIAYLLQQLRQYIFFDFFRNTKISSILLEKIILVLVLICICLIVNQPTKSRILLLRFQYLLISQSQSTLRPLKNDLY